MLLLTACMIVGLLALLCRECGDRSQSEKAATRKVATMARKIKTTTKTRKTKNKKSKKNTTMPLSASKSTVKKGPARKRLLPREVREVSTPITALVPGDQRDGMTTAKAEEKKRPVLLGWWPVGALFGHQAMMANAIVNMMRSQYLFAQAWSSPAQRRFVA